MTIVEMLRACNDGISNEAATTIEGLEEQLKAAIERAEAWKELALLERRRSCEWELPIKDLDRLEELRERLGE